LRGLGSGLSGLDFPRIHPVIDADCSAKEPVTDSTEYLRTKSACHASLLLSQAIRRAADHGLPLVSALPFQRSERFCFSSSE
jgi:hypothetical protein